MSTVKKTTFPPYLVASPKTTITAGLTITTAIPLAIQYINEAYNITSRFEAEIKYIRKRVPNAIESIVNTIPKSVVEYLAQDHLHGLGQDNPTTTAFIRDALKFPSVLMNAYHEVQIGKTHYKYDIYHVISQGLKTPCKLGYIAALSSFYGDVEAASSHSNYFCEVPSRILTELSQLRQDTNSTHIPWYQFAAKNIGPTMLLDSVLTAVAKTTVSDKLGTYIKDAGVSTYWRKLTATVEHTLFGLDVKNAQLSIWGKISTLASESMLEKGKLFVVDLSSKIGHDMLMSYLLTAPARWVSDLFPDHLVPSPEELKDTGIKLAEKLKDTGVKLVEAVQSPNFIANMAAQVSTTDNSNPHSMSNFKNSAYKFTTAMQDAATAFVAPLLDPTFMAMTFGVLISADAYLYTSAYSYQSIAKCNLIMTAAGFTAFHIMEADYAELICNTTGYLCGETPAQEGEGY